jgi:acetophenone carboxylase
MSAADNVPWRRRLSELGRGVGKPHAPLFAPLLYGVASQIEALPPAEVTADPTRLGTCLAALRRATGTAPFVVAAPTGMEAEALGAVVDRQTTWPPQVTAGAGDGVIELADFDDVWARSEALAASLETCKRLSATQQNEPVLLAALTGPASLLSELLGGGAPAAAAYEFAGRALSALSRQFAQSGASAILLCERVPPADVAAWTAALNTIANIARFHRIPALLAFDAGLSPTEWPSATVACPSIGQQGVVREKPQAPVVAPHPAAWADLPGTTGTARAVFTARDVDAGTSIEALADACEAALEIEKENGA